MKRYNSYSLLCAATLLPSVIGHPQLEYDSLTIESDQAVIDENTQEAAEIRKGSSTLQDYAEAPLHAAALEGLRRDLREALEYCDPDESPLTPQAHSKVMSLAVAILETEPYALLSAYATETGGAILHIDLAGRYSRASLQVPSDSVAPSVTLLTRSGAIGTWCITSSSLGIQEIIQWLKTQT